MLTSISNHWPERAESNIFPVDGFDRYGKDLKMAQRGKIQNVSNCLIF